MLGHLCSLLHKSLLVHWMYYRISYCGRKWYRLFKQSGMERYQNLNVLGEGTFGKVFLVRDRQNEEQCVIKQIDIRGMSDKEKYDTRREARILEALKHPYIIRFLGSFDSKPGHLNIVMSYAEGGDLSKRIKQVKGAYFPQNVILGWFTQVAIAIRHIHERKVIHRDLKCENIFLTRDNLVQLGDFGIAKSLKQSMEKIKSVVGTPYYMSPEICDNKDYTNKTDIWSLGVVLYELCALRPPFDSVSIAGLALRICRGEYSPIPNVYSDDMKKLIGKLLTVEPSKRPSIHQVIKTPIIQSRIEQYLTFSQKQQRAENDITIMDNVVSSKKNERAKPSISPKNFDCTPSLIMIPVSPQNNPKESKPKVNDTKKGKVSGSRKREISEPIQSPRQQSKKNMPTTLQIEKKRPPELKGKKIEEFQPATKRKQQSELDQMYESYYLKEIPIEELQEIINSEREVQSKQQEWKQSVSMVLQKYERESLQVEFMQQTQSQTLQALLESRLGNQEFQSLLEVTEKGLGFPGEELTRTLQSQSADLLPLVSLYFGGYLMNLS